MAYLVDVLGRPVPFGLEDTYYEAGNLSLTSVRDYLDMKEREERKNSSLSSLLNNDSLSESQATHAFFEMQKSRIKETEKTLKKHPLLDTD